MIVVNVQEIKKFHAANLVLDGVTLQLQEGEKVGLIGRNGSGKSTLLRLIAGHERVDEGILAIKKDLQIGYLPQIPAEFDERSVYEVLAFGFRDLLELRHSMSRIEQQMSSEVAVCNPALMEQLLKTYAPIQERFEQGGGYEIDTSIDYVASGLQLDRTYDQRAFSSLSGGEKTKVVLASQLVVRPDLLLLDEPTNHLDLKGIEWLEQFLQRYDGIAVVVSHDRYFLDTISTKIIELEDGVARTYRTNYSGYMKEKQAYILEQSKHYEEQQKTIKKMKETIHRLEEWGRIGDNEKFFKRAASMRKALDKMEVLKRPQQEKTADFHLSLKERSGQKVIAFEGVSKRFGERVVLNGAEESLGYGEKVVLLGENGAGKTTLFHLLLGELEPDAGVVNQGTRLSIGYLAQQELVRDSQKTVLEFFRVEAALEEGEARNVLASYLFYGTDVFKPLAMLSGGEWSRLRLALLVRRQPNLLLLDEPTNHLDVASREALEEALESFPGTILAISHDRYFINRLAKRIWELREGTITSYLGHYDDFKEKSKERWGDARRHEGHEGSARGDESEHSAQKKASRIEVPQLARQKADTTKKAEQQKQLRTEQQRMERLELEIAALEAELKLADERLTELEAEGHTEQLEVEWFEREAKQSRLDVLMDVWVNGMEK